MLRSSVPVGIRPPKGQKPWPQLDGDEVQTDLLDVNKTIFDEMARHTKAMSAIYARHSETSSSDMNSGASSPDTEHCNGLGMPMDWDADGEGADLKECMRTSLTGGTPIADLGGEERVDDLLEQERFEKSIFVKAALQLLLERACVPTVLTSGSGGPGAGSGAAQEGAGGSGCGPVSSGRSHGAGEEGAGGGGGAGPSAMQHGAGAVIKSGYLKKAAHHSMGTIWKTKQVEIHPGLFVYEDDDNLLGRRRKSIRLIIGTVHVRLVASGRKGYVFELSTAKKGQKRLWMCSSEDDRAEWIKALTDAMLPPQHAADGPNGQAYLDSPFAPDMDRYKSLRSCFEQALDTPAYRSALSSLAHDPQICVPFAWIRTQIADVFPLEGVGPSLMGGLQSMSSLAGPGAGLTQLWKDMMRDKVCINGQVIYGESGPESILGALARCIMTLAARARGHECRSPGMLTFHASAHSPMAHLGSGPILGGGPSLLASSSSSLPPPPHHMLLSPSSHLSGMSEVQAVAYTTEILLACNRTQSGGDTYYCVEYLFRNPSLVVLCPYSSHAEPLQIFLELADENGGGASSSSEPFGGPFSGPELLSGAPLLSDDEGSLPTATSSSHHHSHSHSASHSHNSHNVSGTTSSASRDRRRIPSVRLRSAPAAPPAPLTRSNSLTRLTSLLPPDSPHNHGPTSGVEPLSRSLPHGTQRSANGLHSGYTSGGDPASPPALTSPLSGGGGEGAHGQQDENSLEGAKEGGGRGGGGGGRPVIRVKIQANTSYKICPSDPQDDREDIWSIVSARFEQHFSISVAGMTKGQELIALTTLEGSTGKEGTATAAARDPPPGPTATTITATAVTASKDTNGTPTGATASGRGGSPPSCPSSSSSAQPSVGPSSSGLLCSPIQVEPPRGPEPPRGLSIPPPPFPSVPPPPLPPVASRQGSGGSSPHSQIQTPSTHPSPIPTASAAPGV